MNRISSAADDDVLDWTAHGVSPEVTATFSLVPPAQHHDECVAQEDVLALDDIPAIEKSGEFPVYNPYLKEDDRLPPVVPLAALKARPLGNLRAKLIEDRRRYDWVANKQPELRALYQEEGELERAIERALQCCHELKIGLAILVKYHLLHGNIRTPTDARKALVERYDAELRAQADDSQDAVLSTAALDEIQSGVKMFESHMRVWAKDQAVAQFQLALAMPFICRKRQKLEAEIQAMRAPTMFDLERQERRLAILESQRKSLSDIELEECKSLELGDIVPLSSQEQLIAQRVRAFIDDHEFKSIAETKHDLGVHLRSDPAHEAFNKLYSLLHKPRPEQPITADELEIVEKRANEVAYQSFQDSSSTLQLRIAACASFPEEHRLRMKAAFIEKTAEKLALLRAHENTWPLRRARIWNVVGHRVLGIPLKAALPLTQVEKAMQPMIEAEAQQVLAAVRRTLTALEQDPAAKQDILRTEAAVLTRDLRPKFYEVLAHTAMPTPSIRPSQTPASLTMPTSPLVMPAPLLPTPAPEEVSIATASRWTKLGSAVSQFGRTLFHQAQSLVQAISLPKLVKSRWPRWAMAAAALVVAAPRETANGDSSFNEHMANFSSTIDTKDLGEVLSFRQHQQHQFSRVLRTENGRPVEWLNYAATTSFPIPPVVNNAAIIGDKKYDGHDKLTDGVACYGDDQVLPTRKVTLVTPQGETTVHETAKRFFYPYTVTMDHGPNNIVAAFDRYMSSDVFALAYPHYVRGPFDQTLLYEWTEGPRAHHVLHRVMKNDVLDFATSPNGDIYITEWMRAGRSMLPYAQPIRVRVYPIREALGQYSRLASSTTIHTPVGNAVSRLCTTGICW